MNPQAATKLSPWCPLTNNGGSGWTRHYSTCSTFIGAAVLDTGFWRVITSLGTGPKTLAEGNAASVTLAKRMASLALLGAVAAHYKPENCDERGGWVKSDLR